MSVIPKTEPTLYWCARNPGLINCEKHMWNSDIDKVTAADRRYFASMGETASCEECDGLVS